MFFYLEYFLFINIPTSLGLMKYIDWKIDWFRAHPVP